MTDNILCPGMVLTKMDDVIMECEHDDPSVKAFIDLLAWDEIDQLQSAMTPEDFNDLLLRLDKRRDCLDEVSNRRYCNLVGQHDEIQSLFDYIGAPLGDFNSNTNVALAIND